MIHRAPFGSMERFIAVLLEHCAGNFPLWLTPEQVTILPISERFNEHSQKLMNELKSYDIRAILDDRDEKIGKKIRDAEMEKIPFMLVIGEKEQAENKVAVRRHGKGDLGVYSLPDFIKLFQEEASLPSS